MFSVDSVFTELLYAVISSIPCRAESTFETKKYFLFTAGNKN